MYRVCRKAVDRARRDEGPTLIESVTMRMQGHSASDDASYVPPGLLEAWKAKDPLERYERTLRTAGILTDTTIAKTDEAISREIDEAMTYALQRPYPDGRDAAADVYAPAREGGAG